MVIRFWKGVGFEVFELFLEIALKFYQMIEILNPVRQPYFSQPNENRVFSERDRLFGNIAVKSDLIAK